MDGVRKTWARTRRWTRVGERVLLVGKHPFAGEEAVVLRMEVPWGVGKLFGRFPRVRTESGREEFIVQKGEWRSMGPESIRLRAKQAAR